MNRSNDLSIQSAPEAVSMSRTTSSFGSADNGFGLDYHRKSLGGGWCNSYNNYTFGSTTPNSTSFEASFEPTAQTDEVNVNVYDPSDYLLTIPEEPLFNPVQNDMTYSQQWGMSGDLLSPNTPTLSENYSDSSSSSQLSRQGSTAASINDAFDMVKIQSNFSFSDGGSPPIAFSTPDKANSLPIALSEDQRSHFLNNFNFVGDEDFNASREQFSTVTSQAQLSFLSDNASVQEMDRTASDESNMSQASINNRAQRRRQEINAQGERKIAPKKEREAAASLKQSSDHKMVRIESQDGTAKQVAAIKRQPYVRPHHPKIYCKHCNQKPDGFRGEHELRRHTDRVHSKMRKMWITVDVSSNQDFLSRCKACTTGKRYGVYYNAAAHLRRAHFNPRKRGRKGKNDEKRGGKAGGDWPPMDWLKQQGWLREVEELVPDHTDDQPSDDTEEEETSPKVEDLPEQDVDLQQPADHSLANFQPFDAMSVTAWYGQMPSDQPFNGLGAMEYDPSFADPTLTSAQAFHADMPQADFMVGNGMPHSCDGVNVGMNMHVPLFCNGQQWK